MEAIEQALNDLGAGISQQLRTDIASKSVTKYGPVNASGKLAKSIRYDVTPNNLKVYALNYFYYVENGRKGGKRPPRSVIRQWIIDKGIKPQGKISIDSLAFLIQRKIGESGTTAFQQGGTKLLEDVATKERIDMVRQQIALTMQNQLIRTAFSNVIIQ